VLIGSAGRICCMVDDEDPTTLRCFRVFLCRCMKASHEGGKSKGFDTTLRYSNDPESALSVHLSLKLDTSSMFNRFRCANELILS